MVRIKCFFCGTYSSNMYYHKKYKCKKWVQISDDIYFHFIEPQIRYNKLKNSFRIEKNIFVNDYSIYLKKWGRVFDIYDYCFCLEIHKYEKYGNDKFTILYNCKCNTPMKIYIKKKISYLCFSYNLGYIGNNLGFRSSIKWRDNAKEIAYYEVLTELNAFFDVIKAKKFIRFEKNIERIQSMKL